MSEPVQTGNPVVDEACRQVADLSDLPLAEHPDALARAHEAISSVLEHAPLVPLPGEPR